MVGDYLYGFFNIFQFRFPQWDTQLRNVKFEIRIDHKNLEYFMTVKKLTERQIKWSLILYKYNFVINYITGKNNERTDAFSERERDVPEAGDDKLKYKMAQLLKPGILNFEPRTNERPELDQSETVNLIEIQPVVTGKNGAEFQLVNIQEPENELENLWATAKNNDYVYQSVVGAIKKGKQTLLTFLVIKISIGDCSLNNNESLFFSKEEMGA